MARSEDNESGAADPMCAECGAGPAIIILGGVQLCDRCYDARTSEASGWPRLPEPPPPETITDPDGRRHRIVYRVWRSPAGIVVEASEGDRSFEGYHAKVLGWHEADVATLVEQTKSDIRRRIGRQDLVRSPSGNMIMAGDKLRGRLVWQERGMPYGVVVDGLEMSWEEFGLALEPFEGWEFRISIDDGIVVEDEPGSPSDDGSAIAFLPAPDEHIH